MEIETHAACALIGALFGALLMALAAANGREE